MAEHDQLFKWTFRVPEHAAGELRAVLPAELVEAIDFDSLELVQSDLVSRQLDERFSDALFHATLRGVPGYVWLLLEHQSEPDRFMPLRVLEYLVRSWVELLRREPDRKMLPPVVCVVVHQGESGWTGPTRLHDLIEGLEQVPALKELVPDFELVVDDLIKQPDEELKRRPLGALAQLVLWVLRDGRQKQRLYAHLQTWAAELRQTLRVRPEDATTVLRYVFTVLGEDSFEEFQRRITEAAPEAQTIVATMGEQLIQKGRIQGRAEGKAEAIFAVLEARGLVPSTEQRARILGSKDLGELERWLTRAVTTADVEGLFSH